MTLVMRSPPADDGPLLEGIAIGFYEKMGRAYVRASDQTEWGRHLNVMDLELHG